MYAIRSYYARRYMLFMIKKPHRLNAVGKFFVVFYLKLFNPFKVFLFGCFQIFTVNFRVVNPNHVTNAKVFMKVAYRSIKITKIPIVFDFFGNFFKLFPF